MSDSKNYYISPRFDQAWWRLSDEDVSNVAEGEVLGQGGVFMLFYERSDIDLTPLSQVSTETAVNAPSAVLHTPLSLVDDLIKVCGSSPVPSDDATRVPLPDDDSEAELYPDLRKFALMTTDSNLDGVRASRTMVLHASSSSSDASGSAQQPAANGDISLPDAEESQSTNLTSDEDESETDYLPSDVPVSQPIASHSPALMRTAGVSGHCRTSGSRSSLPMVAAT
ncbi:uncharacterized protein BDZ99DRAFT_548679 [Mytilinidion resinicola]|uniref:Cysteine proteinase n=1 Tax=Mytilinidion resinicola TaxID=574789 RepID=A0A6A6Z0C1_9PEZI|nr:uncharacterized protein BDZ99DRAFT_548679 [Mytilinidion resinicola]KAF2814626.1 hypothetical protein BDZ99DRAFT_548679 [Mytilinidion resinicola]